jgi:hypothetical protein
MGWWRLQKKAFLMIRLVLAKTTIITIIGIIAYSYDTILAQDFSDSQTILSFRSPCSGSIYGMDAKQNKLI